MRIAIDAMGGDYAPGEIVAGTLAALDHVNGDELILIGDENLIRPMLGDPRRWEGRLQIEHAPEVIAMDDPPVEAIRKKRNSSINLMAKMGSDGRADVVISAGNTGACVAACQMRMRLLPGVHRPGILVVFPTFAGPVVAIDVGANIAPKPSHLHQYAIMGSIYAREVVKIPNPRLGLISIGQEDAKGNELVKRVNQLLREDERIDFIGNVEPREFLNRPADVVICDGFVGNVILKLTEGLAEGLFKAILRELSSYDAKMAEAFKPVMQRLYAKHDYNEYGGAPLLGVDGTAIICHGSSNAHAMKTAIICSRRQAQANVNQKIAQQVGSMPAEDA